MTKHRPNTRPRRALALALASLLTTVTGCASARSASSFRVEQPFPSEAELEQISQRPAPTREQLFTEAPVPVDAWTLRGPLPESTALRPYAGEDPFARATAELVKGDDDRRVTEGMSCLAREYGRFVLAHQGRPSQELQHFMAARCGALSVTFGVRSWQLKTPDEVDEHEAPPLEVGRELLEEALSTAPPRATLGAWAGSAGGRSIVIVTAGAPQATITALPVATGGDGFVELRGRLERPHGWLQGYSTRGEFAYSRCEPIDNMALAPDEFGLRCPVDARDDIAILELVAAEPGRVLGGTVLRVLVSPSGADANHYALRSPGAGQAGSRDADSLLAAINGLRGSLGLATLRGDTAQSALVDNLFPHFLAARNKFDGGRLIDQIATGMMAGWKVEGLIRGSQILTLRSHASRSMERALAESLFSPSNRAVLLNPDARSTALATLVDDEAESSAAMVVTYEYFEQRDYAREQSAFLDALDRARRNRGLPPVTRVNGPVAERVLGAGMTRVQRGESAPDEELSDVLREFVNRSQRGFQGAIYSTLVLDGWQPRFSEDLLSARDIEVAVKIGHYRPSQGAWGHHVVFVVFTVLQ